MLKLCYSTLKAINEELDIITAQGDKVHGCLGYILILIQVRLMIVWAVSTALENFKVLCPTSDVHDMVWAVGTLSPAFSAQVGWERLPFHWLLSTSSRRGLCQWSLVRDGSGICSEKIGLSSFDFALIQ